MKIPEKFKEYIWLVNTIRWAGELTFEELQEKWLQTEMSGGVEMAKSTFHRNKEAVEDIFGLFIDCDKKRGYRYFIGNDQVLKEHSVQNWMLSTLSVSNIVTESMAVQDRILLEEVACNDSLPIIIEAMKRKVRIEVTYRRYGSDSLTHVDFEPYCIKLFHQRWYVLGHFYRPATEDRAESNYYGMYAFDRMVEVKLTDVRFEFDESMDVKQYFSECWGVFVDDGMEAERIVIRAFGRERFYLRDLPLHHSQRSVDVCDEYEDFEVVLRPTHDFCIHLLSMASGIRVLSPPSLVNKLREMLKATLALYEEE